MSKSNEGITTVFEKFNKLTNDLQLNGKYYETKGINMKFLLPFLEHLKHKKFAIRKGKDITKLSLETLYGILKIYKLQF